MEPIRWPACTGLHSTPTVETQWSERRTHEREEVLVLTTRAHNRGSWFVASAALAMAIPAAGCSRPTAPPPPPGGGQALALSYTRFESEIEPILVRHGCDAGGDCHGGGIRGTLELSPATAKNVRFDFDQVSLQVSAADPPNSAILTEPLADSAGGTAHQLKPFANTGDADYQAILAWILDGVTP